MIVTQKLGGLCGDTLKACMLEIGLECGYGAYPVGLGLTVDKEGNLRTDGFVLTRDGVRGVVFKRADGSYASLTIDLAGNPVVTPLGTTEP